MLYEVRGSNWTLPVEARWHDVIAEVWLPESFPWLNKQKELVEAWLRTSGDFRDGKWWILKNRFEKGAVLSTFTDPEDVVEWGRQPRPITEQTGTGGYSEPFISGYISSPWAVIHDPVVMEVIWCSLQKYMLHLLVNEKKVIDLFFVKLYPLLFRSNWKEIAVRREIRAQKKRKTTKYDPQPEKIIERGMADELANESMTAYDESSGVCSWSIEAVTQAPFVRQMEKLERRLRNRFGGRYAALTAERLKRQLKYALEVYSEFLKASAYPYLILFRPGEKGSNGVCDRKQVKYVRAQKHDRSGEGNHVLSADEFERTAPAVEEAPAPLPPEMPPVQPTDEELRHSWKKAIER